MENNIKNKALKWFFSSLIENTKLFKDDEIPEDGIDVDMIINKYNEIQEEKKRKVNEKIKNNKHWPELYVPNVTEKSWGEGAFTIAFVYSNKGNFVLKGWLGDINEYLKLLNKKGYKYFYYYSMYKDGNERGVWSFYKDDTDIFEPTFNKKSKSLEPYHYVVKNYVTGKKFKFKRLPNKWIPEFDEL